MVMAESQPWWVTTRRLGAEWARGSGAIGVAAFVIAYVIATVCLVPASPPDRVPSAWGSSLRGWSRRSSSS